MREATKSSPRFWTIVPAAGVGQRMQSELPKQYLQLRNATVIEHTLSALFTHESIEAITVAIAAHDTWWKASTFSGDARITTVQGGADRAESVLNALEELVVVAQESDWVLVHDAARPCLQREDIDRLISTVLKEDVVGAVLAIPMSDTTKQSADDGLIEKTLDRSTLWRACTPQVFRVGDLLKALRHAKTEQLEITDESSAIELMGGHPKLVKGQPSNIKITEPDDLLLAEYYLQRFSERSTAACE